MQHIYDNVDIVGSLFDNYNKPDKLILNLLINQGLDVNKNNNNGHSLLFYAVAHKNLNFTKDLSETAASIIEPSIIHYIHNIINILKSFIMNLSIYKKFMEEGLNLNQEDKERNTLLIYALEARHYETIQYLFEHTANIDVINNHIEIIKLLKFDKISFNKEIRKVLDLLIKYGLDINRKDNDDNTPLIYAINVKNEEIVSYFLNHQANIQAVNEKIIIIDSLIVNKNVRNYYYSHSDTDKEIKNNILKMLINHGLNVNSVDKEGKLPIVYAIEKNNKEVLKLFFNHHADIDYFNNDISLIKALFINNEEYYYREYCYKKKLESLKLLEEHGLDLERSDNDHKYPLIYALEAENDFAFQYLLEKELDFKSFISTLYNRLSELSLLLNDYNNIFDLLIKNGFDVNRKDQHGKTLLNYEIEKKETDSSIIFYLLEFRRNFNLKMTQNKESFFEYLRSFSIFQSSLYFSYHITNAQENIINYFNNNISIFESIFKEADNLKIINFLIILIHNGLNIDGMKKEIPY